MVNYRIEITGRRTDLEGLVGVYTVLALDLFADNGEGRVERTDGEVRLSAPVPKVFVPVEEVTGALKFEWLSGQYPDGWLAEQKALLSARFSAPVVTADFSPDTISL